MTRPRPCSRVILAGLVSAVGLASPALARGPEDVKQSGIVTIEKVPNRFPTSKLYSHDRIMKALSDNLGDAKQVNIFAFWCNSGGLIDAAKANAPGFKFAIAAATTRDQITQRRIDEENNAGGTRPSFILNNTPPFYYIADYEGFAGQAVSAKWDNVNTFKKLVDFTSNAYDTDPLMAKAPDKGSHPRLVSEGAEENAALNGGADGNHLLGFYGDVSERGPVSLIDFISRNFYGSLKFRTEPKTSALYVGTKDAGNGFAGEGSKANFLAGLTNLKTELAKNKGKETVNLLLGGHGFYQTVSKDLQANAAPLQPRNGRVFNPGASVVDFDMGALEWAYLTAPSTPDGLTDANLRQAPPEVFVTISEGSIDQPVGLWLNDLFLGEFDLAIGSRGGELRVALTDLQIGQLVSMYGGSASLNLRIELAGSSWFRLGSDADVLSDELYDVGSAGAGMSFFMSQVPTPGTLALLALAGLGASRRRRN